MDSEYIGMGKIKCEIVLFLPIILDIVKDCVILRDRDTIIHRNRCISQLGEIMGKRKLPDILTEEETKKLLDIPNHRYPTSYRNYCMMKLSLETGMRISELIHLMIENIDWNTGKVFIRSGKGDKDRIIYLRNGMLEELKALRERFNFSNTGNLFTTLKGCELDDGYLRKMIKRVAEKSGITKRTYFHLLRHTFGSNTYRDTKDIRTLQEILGHSDISTTMLYSTISNDDVKRVMTRKDGK